MVPYIHVLERAMVEVSEARVHGPAVREVEASGQVHVALHPERIKRVHVSRAAFDSNGHDLNAGVLQLKVILRSCFYLGIST